MNIKAVIVATSLLFISISGFAQYHYIQKLSESASIAFPDTPKIIIKSDIKQYLVKYNGVLFSAIASDVSKGLRDIFSNSNTDSVYNGFLQGLIKGSKGKLFYKDKIKINGHPAIQFGYTAKLKQQQIYGYYRVVSLNDTLIATGIVSADSISKNHEVLTNFFANFKLESAEKLAAKKTHNTAFKVGRVLGFLFVVAFFAGIGFGIVALIKKTAYRKENI